jgi:hypothetical protein
MEGMERIIQIKHDQITRDELDEVIVGLEVACGGNKIEVTESFELIVKDDRQVVALKALFGGNGKREKAVKHPHTKKVKSMGALSYRFETTGEIISAIELNKRLKSFNIPDGVVLVNAKGKKFCVKTKLNVVDSEASIFLEELASQE